MGSASSYDVEVPDIYLDSDDDATGLSCALEAEGYTTSLKREGFAGEDDSEDRAWVLVVAPFDDRVAALAEAHGGWLPGDDRPAAPPLDLPSAPKRLKG
ncbi:MAG: hypothetical protein JWR55_2738 [Aeromicrobium sp.]|jgi:hypothetical protein|nr:hypothetical protein [Aeromicrobium sp.]